MMGIKIPIIVSLIIHSIVISTYTPMKEIELYPEETVLTVALITEENDGNDDGKGSIAKIDDDPYGENISCKYDYEEEDEE